MSDEGIRTAPLSGRWLRKLAIILVVLIGFGGWGLYDALVVYPKRGERYASWAEWQYLEAAFGANAEDFGIFQREASVPSPGEEHARLGEPARRSQNAADASNQNSSRRLRAAMQNARFAWLDGLDRIGQLRPERTTISDPSRRLEDLRRDWNASSNPKPLSAFDIPSQWLIMGVCWGIALVMIVHMIRVASRKYRWDPATMALTIPGGQTITPGDLEEVDKRKWDKFLVFLKIKPGHPTLGGREIKCDLYQRRDIEDWVLAMKREAFGPDEPDEPDEAGAEPEQPVSTRAPQSEG